ASIRPPMAVTFRLRAGVTRAVSRAKWKLPGRDGEEVRSVAEASTVKHLWLLLLVLVVLAAALAGLVLPRAEQPPSSDRTSRVGHSRGPHGEAGEGTGCRWSASASSAGCPRASIPVRERLEPAADPDALRCGSSRSR